MKAKLSNHEAVRVLFMTACRQFILCQYIYERKKAVARNGFLIFTYSASIFSYQNIPYVNASCIPTLSACLSI